MANFNLDNYVPVNARLSNFYLSNPAGRVQTSIVEHDRESGFVMVRAEIFRDAVDTIPAATGHAFEERGVGHVNKTSYIENCETSAVGRALALLGYEIAKSIASRQEMEKVERMTAKPVETPTPVEIPTPVETPKPSHAVERQNGLYLVDQRFKVTKPNGKIACDCDIAGCPHIEAVRAFAVSAN